MCAGSVRMASKKSRKAAPRSQTGGATRRQSPTGRGEQSYRPTTVEPAEAPDALTPLEHYKREKARRNAERRGAAADPLDEARREYRAMLAADAAKQKGGRPRKTAARPADADKGDEPA